MCKSAFQQLQVLREQYGSQMENQAAVLDNVQFSTWQRTFHDHHQQSQAQLLQQIQQKQQQQQEQQKLYSDSLLPSPNLSAPTQSIVESEDGEDIIRIASNDNIALVGSIVDAIQAYPCLWNTSLRYYKDINKKSESWKELQQILGITFQNTV